jgi:hypothetical protein
MLVENLAVTLQPLTCESATQVRVLRPKPLLIQVEKIKGTELGEIVQPISRRPGNPTAPILPTPLEWIAALSAA